MEALIYFLLIAALLVVMMRFGCGAHVLGVNLGGRLAHVIVPVPPLFNRKARR